MRVIDQFLVPYGLDIIVYSDSASRQLYEQRGRSIEAKQYWTRSAAVRTRLADSLGNAMELRQSLGAYLPVVPSAYE